MKNQADSGYMMPAKLNSGNGIWNSVGIVLGMIVLFLKFVNGRSVSVEV
jgi:hypothetical protein